MGHNFDSFQTTAAIFVTGNSRAAGTTSQHHAVCEGRFHPIAVTMCAPRRHTLTKTKRANRSRPLPTSLRNELNTTRGPTAMSTRHCFWDLSETFHATWDEEFVLIALPRTH